MVYNGLPPEVPPPLRDMNKKSCEQTNIAINVTHHRIRRVVLFRAAVRNSRWTMGRKVIVASSPGSYWPAAITGGACGSGDLWLLLAQKRPRVSKRRSASRRKS